MAQTLAHLAKLRRVLWRDRRRDLLRAADTFGQNPALRAAVEQRPAQETSVAIPFAGISLPCSAAPPRPKIRRAARPSGAYVDAPVSLVFTLGRIPRPSAETSGGRSGQSALGPMCRTRQQSKPKLLARRVTP